MSRPALFVLAFGLGSLVPPLADILAAVLAHEHPFDRS